MTVSFHLSPEQEQLKLGARQFAEEHLRPLAAEVRKEGLATSSASRWSAGRPASVRGSRAVAITRWPWRANSAAAARPMPFDTPVISTDAMTTSWVRKLGRFGF